MTARRRRRASLLRAPKAAGASARRVREPDYALLALSLGMLALGALTLYSASAILADRHFADPLYYMKRQGLFGALGLVSMWVASRVPYQRWREWVWPILAITVVLLAAALLSPPVAGVRRWIRLGPIGIQPAEIAKLTVLLFLADYLDRKRSKLAGFRQGVAVPLAVVGVLLAMIGVAPDLGTPALLFGTSLVVLFVGGTRPVHIAGMIAAAMPVLAFELLRLPYRRARLFSFLKPFENAEGAGYQLAQALTAVGAGGWTGQGLGASKLKLLYLPAPHTDFIFPVLCEELGFAGALAVLVLFAAFLLRGMKIARGAPDLFGTLLAAGISFLIALQAYFNIAMSVGLLPTKGLPLPFFSYGGSSLLVTLTAVGILLNISRHGSRSG